MYAHRYVYVHVYQQVVIYVNVHTHAHMYEISRWSHLFLPASSSAVAAGQACSPVNKLDVILVVPLHLQQHPAAPTSIACTRRQTTVGANSSHTYVRMHTPLLTTHGAVNLDLKRAQ